MIIRRTNNFRSCQRERLIKRSGVVFWRIKLGDCVRNRRSLRHSVDN